MIRVFGDSHAKYLFDNIRGIEVNWLGPVTMHRVGRDGLWFLREKHLAPDDWLLTVFGEIDARCHVGRIADERNTSYEEVAFDLVARYIRSISTSNARKVIVG